jgi:hypothetical protein
MGRTSKFSFPLPGRKRTSSNDKVPAKSPSAKSSGGGTLSKAQRFFGTDNDLNIDSPTRGDDLSWKYPSSRSSAMSISISESTQSTRSTAETGSITESQSDQWDHESGVFPRGPPLHVKASSTLLGQRYKDDGTTSLSTKSERLRNEDSSSTLKSYYDRQKSPLSISQQTSESSARDLALRKGLPQVIQRSPLLQVELVDLFDQDFAGSNHGIEEGAYDADSSRNKGARKKPAKLDLSMLFPRPRGHGGKKNVADALSPSSMSTNNSRSPEIQPAKSSRKKLTKAPSKESLNSQKYSNRSNQPSDPKFRQTSGTLYQLYDHYEQLPFRSPPMDQIPESRVPDQGERRMEREDSRRQPAFSPGNSLEQLPSPSDSFPWKNAQASMKSPPCPWEASSAASISSHNTKGSRRTSTSAFSNSDLKQNSVLSLSSDSEESDEEPTRSPSISSNYKADRVLNGSHRHSSQQAGGAASRRESTRKGAAQPSPFLSIPEASLPSSRLSGPWSPPDIELPERPKNARHPSHRDSRQSMQKEKRSSRKTLSVQSARSSLQPTPPISPTSVEFREVPEQSNRFMAVTKQEEALLEALRQKRARMREKIIEEHETTKSPSRTTDRKAARISEASSVSTIRAPASSKHKEQILLYLDTPINGTQRIDTAEPSPDLSDFLSFGSDDDSTPRTSYAAPKISRGQARPDSGGVSPNPRIDKLSPKTPPSAARLSAVGAVHGLKEDRLVDQGMGSKKRNTGVRFLEDSKPVQPQDFFLEENETDVIWGM